MHDSGYPLHVMHEYRMDPDELDDFLKVLTRGPLDQVPGISVVSRQRQALLAAWRRGARGGAEGREAGFRVDFRPRSPRGPALFEASGEGAEEPIP